MSKRWMDPHKGEVVPLRNGHHSAPAPPHPPERERARLLNEIRLVEAQQQRDGDEPKYRLRLLRLRASVERLANS